MKKRISRKAIGTTRRRRVTVRRVRNPHHNYWELENFIDTMSMAGYGQARTALREISEDDELWELLEKASELKKQQDAIKAKIGNVMKRTSKLAKVAK